MQTFQSLLLTELEVVLNWQDYRRMTACLLLQSLLPRTMRVWELNSYFQTPVSEVINLHGFSGVQLVSSNIFSWVCCHVVLTSLCQQQTELLRKIIHVILQQNNKLNYDTDHLKVIFCWGAYCEKEFFPCILCSYKAEFDSLPNNTDFLWNRGVLY